MTHTYTSILTNGIILVDCGLKARKERCYQILIQIFYQKVEIKKKKQNKTKMIAVVV